MDTLAESDEIEMARPVARPKPSSVSTSSDSFTPDGEISAPMELSGYTHQRIGGMVLQRLFDRKPEAMRIGRFSVLERIGRGGMGTVYAAYDEQLDRKVAVKVLANHSRGEIAQRRLMREAQAMARLSHPNVVTVHEVGESDDGIFVAMEFIRGQSLDAWIQTEPQWPQVVEAFVQAGRGLMAAHEAGIIHRDLKPHNVMRTEDGVVKVLDFGLARAAGEEPTELSEDSGSDGAEDSPATSGSALETELTKTGAVMGTPAYMSPEQHRGQPADARSDQFSFCVAMYEALFRRRPFSGSSLAALADSVLSGEMEAPPPQVRVPSWLIRVVERGLSVDPDERWPSMAALVEALEHDTSRSRSRLGWALGGAVVVAGLLGLAVSQQAAGPAPCPVASAERGLLWSSARQERIAEAFERSGSPLASDTLGRVTPVVDGYLDELGQMRAGACEAHRRGEHSDRLFDLRTACLDVRRAGLDEMLTGLEHADATTVHNAAWAVASLPSVEPCGDTEALTAAIAPPQDAAVAQQVQAHREDLAGVASLVLVGAYEEAQARAESVRKKALAIGYAPLVAEAELRLGHALMESYQHEAALEALSRGVTEALRAGHDEVAVEALARRMWVLADPLRRSVEAKDDDEIATALLDRIGQPTELQWLLLNNRGVAQFRAGRRAAAEASYREALAVLGDDGERAHPVPHISTRFNLAMLLSVGLGDPAAAATELATLRDRAVELLGPEHPRVGIITMRLGADLVAAGRYDEAWAELDDGLARWSGPDDALLRALLLVERAHLAEQLRRFDDARRDAREAQRLAGVDALGTVAASIEANAAIGMGEVEAGIDLLYQVVEQEVARVGPDQETTATAHSWAGYGLHRAGRLDEAAAQLERAREIFTGMGLDAASHLGQEFSALVAVQIERGALERAETVLEETQRAQDEAGFAEDNAHRFLVAKLRGDLLAVRGENAAAAAAYARACVGLVAEFGARNPDVAECRLAWARAVGLTEEGRSLAKRAANAFADLGEGFAAEHAAALALGQDPPTVGDSSGE